MASQQRRATHATTAVVARVLRATMQDVLADTEGCDAMNQRLAVREHLAGAAAYMLLATAFPRVGHLLLWPTRLGPRGLLVYVAGDTLFCFALIHYLLPHAKRIAEESDQLKNKLGREPTNDELAEHFGYRSKG